MPCDEQFEAIRFLLDLRREVGYEVLEGRPGAVALYTAVQQALERHERAWSRETLGLAA